MSVNREQNVVCSFHSNSYKVSKETVYRGYSVTSVRVAMATRIKEQ